MEAECYLCGGVVQLLFPSIFSVRTRCILQGIKLQNGIAVRGFISLTLFECYLNGCEVPFFFLNEVLVRGAYYRASGFRTG